jgi:hypothetical protein
MNVFTHIALLGWIPVMLVIFAALPPRRATITSFLAAWMFLPERAGYAIQGLPDYDKVSATCAGILLATFIFDLQRLTRFRPHWLDLPMLIWCVAPFLSSVANGLGAYDGMSGVIRQTTLWGLPYFIGRLYFSDLQGLRELAIGIFIGGLVYVPLCWLELRMSPQLHNWVYGYHQHLFIQAIRGSGYRPMVFMQHGLMVAMWMATASLIGVWLWRTKALRQLFGIPVSWLVIVLLITTVLCKSIGALILLAVGAGLLYAVPLLKTRRIVYVVAVVPLLYVGARCVGWNGSELVSAAELFAPAKRVESFAARLSNEDLLARRALQRPVFGWGGWGRNRVQDEFTGEDRAVTDSLWIIAFGTYGAIGLVAAQAFLLVPTLVAVRRVPVSYWRHPNAAPLVVLTLVLLLYLLDNLLNAMINPIFLLAAGGVAAVAASRPAARSAPAAAYQPTPARSWEVVQ